MYKEFYGLTTYPFALTPDPRFLYLSKNHKSCLYYLSQSLEQGCGLIVLTGEFGTGKTLLIHTLIKNLDEKTYCAFLVHAHIDSIEIITCNSQALESEITRKSQREFLASIKDLILSGEKKHKKIVLIIDEAQNISNDIVEELLLLRKLSIYKDSVVQVILSGQPDLEPILSLPKVVPFVQHINSGYRLLPMNYRETKNYIEKRLNRAGATHPIFTPLTIKKIFGVSKGIPRTINLLCHSALLFGFSYEKSKIEHKIIQQVMHELHLHIPETPRDHHANRQHRAHGMQANSLPSSQDVAVPESLSSIHGPAGRQGVEFAPIQRGPKWSKRLPLLTGLLSISLLGLGFVRHVSWSSGTMRGHPVRLTADASLGVLPQSPSQRDQPLLPQSPGQRGQPLLPERPSQRDQPLLPQSPGQRDQFKRVQWEQTTIAYQLSVGKPFTVSLPPLQRIPETLPVKVTLDVSGSTPRWLTFHQDKLVLSGTVPFQEAGKTYYLTLHAQTADGFESPSQLVVSLVIQKKY